LFLFVGCDTNEEEIKVEEQISSLEVKSTEEVDKVVEEVNSIVEQAYVEEENGISTSRNDDEVNSNFFPECLTKTVVRTDNSKIVTLDFGEGCFVRGHFIAGILTMSYQKDRSVIAKTIVVEFDSFKIDHKLVVGSYSIVRMRENENPQSTSTVDITVTWDNGDFVSREGEKVREWIEGYGSRIWSDNVYLITGYWNSTLKNGTVLSAEITTPLRRELVCRFFVSGVIELQKNGRSATLNFGDGDCDNEAVLTLPNGNEIIIYLS